MKTWFTLFLALLAGNSLYAQTIVYSENFDAFPSYSIVGWHMSFSGMVPWQAGIPYQVGSCFPPTGGPMSLDQGTDKVACITDCGAFNYNNSNVLASTPSIDMTGVSGAWLQYDSYFQQYTDGVYTEHATVEISIDGGTTWAVVQAVPANPSLGNFHTWHIDLAAYNNKPDIRIGFRYNDGGGWMTGWAIDNVAVIIPAQTDLSLLSVTPTDTLLGFVPVGQGFIHHAMVYNAGLDTVHAFSLQYRQGTGAIKSTAITGMSLAPFSATDIASSIPDVVTAQGAFPVTMWIVMPGDANVHNDTVHTTISGADFMPAKRLAIEDGEATWNGWSPRIMTYLNGVAGTGAQASMISVHHGDPMSYQPYDDYITGLYDDYVPYILFDRKKHIPIDSFYTYLDKEKQYFGYADISVNAFITSGSVTVSGEITPAIDLVGDYRVALVITEDGIHGTDTTYNQANNYAGSSLGPMGGYELLPNPVPAASMTYDHVPRTISPTFAGTYGLLPHYAYSSNQYEYALTAALDPAWQIYKLKFIVLLLNNADSTVLNCNETQFFPLAVAPTTAATRQAGIYPNPAGSNAHVFFGSLRNETVHISVTDMSGRQLYECPSTNFVTGGNEVTIPVQQFQSGIYLVNLVFEDSKKTLKLEVTH